MKNRVVLKILILASVTAFNISEVVACDSLLQDPSFSRDCAIQDRYRAVRETFRKYKKDVTDVNEYKALRFIDRQKWERDGIIKEMPAKFIYQPAPSTWYIWEGGIQSLFPSDKGAGRLAEMIRNNTFNNSYFSMVNKVLLTNGVVSVKDKVTDQTIKEGEIRTSFRSAPGYCSYDSYSETRRNLSRVKESVSAYQSEWEKKAQISFKEMIKQLGGLSSSKASMVPDMLISGHPCPWDYNGNFVFYASSRDVLNNLDWMQIFVRYNLQRYENSNPVVSPIELAAIVQKWLVSVHPFADGNGRTSRAVQDLILQNFDLPFAPGGDLQEDALVDVQPYIELTYQKTEEMMTVLENCAQELKEAKKISYSCQATAILNK